MVAVTIADPFAIQIGDAEVHPFTVVLYILGCCSRWLRQPADRVCTECFFRLNLAGYDVTDQELAQTQDWFEYATVAFMHGGVHA